MYAADYLIYLWIPLRASVSYNPSKHQQTIAAGIALLAGPSFAGPSCVADGLRINRARVLMIITDTTQ